VARGCQYSMVVYLDSDFLVVRSIDDLFDRQIR
jgi:alpha-N-acetylglucosamine transferase